MGPEHCIHGPGALVFIMCFFLLVVVVQLWEGFLKPKHWAIFLGCLAIGALGLSIFLRDKWETQEMLLAATVFLAVGALIFGSRK